MGLGEKDGEEFDQIKVALIPVFKPHVPNEFGLGGHVVVSDHAAVPPTTKLHSDVTSDEVMGEGKGGITWDPSLPMGRRGLRWWGRGGRDRRISPPVGDIVRRGCGRMTKSCPLAAPPTYKRGWYQGGRGRSGWRRQGSRVRGASAVGDRRVRVGHNLGVEKGGRAWTNRWGGSEGDTRCSHRYC